MRAALPYIALALWGLLFVFTGALKLANPSAFAKEISAHGITGPGLSEMLAVTIPWVECLAGSALCIGRLQRGAWLILSALLLGFLGINIRAAVLHLEINCGCFGQTWSTGPGFMAVIDLILLFYSGLLWRNQQCTKSLFKLH